MLNLTMLPGSSSRSTKFDDELILRRSFSSYHSPWTANLISSLCRTHGSNNPLLHHSFDLMSSPTDYIFMKPLDKRVVIIINILSVSRISIEFMMGDIILAPHDDCVNIDNILAFPQHKTGSRFVLYLEFLAIQLMLYSTVEYYHLWCRGCCENCSTSWEFLTYKYFSPSSFISWSPCCF